MNNKYMKKIYIYIYKYYIRLDIHFKMGTATPLYDSTQTTSFEASVGLVSMVKAMA